MELTEIIDQVKKLMILPLNEGYREAKELDTMATAIINLFAQKNYPMVNRVRKEGLESIGFHNDYLTLRRIAEPGDYTVLKQFITRSGLVIMFENEMSANGSYTSGASKRVTINLFNKKFLEALKYQLELHKNDEVISPEDSLSILQNTMGVGFRIVLTHELQHAYDSFVSNDFYLSDDKSKRYYKRGHEEEKNPQYKRTKEEYNIYLSLPHEYWARFSETINTININKTPQAFMSEFQRLFRGWDVMSNNTKQRLSKAVYKFYDLNKAVAEV